MHTIQEAKNILDKIYADIVPDEFILSDPVSVPKRFILKQDIEIAAFFTCILAWGQRTTIIRNCLQLMHWMGEEPYNFILNHKQKDLIPFEKFVHRTFNGSDCLYFIHALNKIYSQHSSMETVFNGESTMERIMNFRRFFLDSEYLPGRTSKHIANPRNNSSAKRLNMFLRWMVRKDEKGIDFGIWKSIPMAQLHCPLDVHVMRASHDLGLLKRKQQDWKAVSELHVSLTELNAKDPIKYDLPLFLYGQRLSKT